MPAKRALPSTTSPPQHIPTDYIMIGLFRHPSHEEPQAGRHELLGGLGYALAAARAPVSVRATRPRAAHKILEIPFTTLFRICCLHARSAWRRCLAESSFHPGAKTTPPPVYVPSSGIPPRHRNTRPTTARPRSPTTMESMTTTTEERTKTSRWPSLLASPAQGSRSFPGLLDTRNKHFGFFTAVLASRRCNTLAPRLVRYGLVWLNLVWFGLVWFGLVLAGSRLVFDLWTAAVKIKQNAQNRAS